MDLKIKSFKDFFKIILKQVEYFREKMLSRAQQNNTIRFAWVLSSTFSSLSLFATISPSFCLPHKTIDWPNAGVHKHAHETGHLF